MNRSAPVARRLFDPHTLEHDPIYEFDAPKCCDFAARESAEQRLEREQWFDWEHPTHEPQTVEDLLKNARGGGNRLSRRGDQPLDLHPRETAALEEEFRFLLQKAKLIADIDPTGFNPDSFEIKSIVAVPTQQEPHSSSQASRKSLGHTSPKSLNLKGGARRVPVAAESAPPPPANSNNNKENQSHAESATSPRKAAHATHSRGSSTPPRLAPMPALQAAAPEPVAQAPELAVSTSPVKAQAAVVLPVAALSSSKSPARVPAGVSPKGLSPRSLKLGAPLRVKVQTTGAAPAQPGPLVRAESAAPRRVAAMHFCAAPNVKKP